MSRPDLRAFPVKASPRGRSDHPPQWADDADAADYKRQQAPGPVWNAFGAQVRRGGPPLMPPRRAQHSLPVPRPIAPTRERYTPQPSQGDDEDWPPDAPIRIADATAVARTHGDVAVRTSRGKDLDIHELLKKEAFASPSAACDNHFEKNRPCPDDIYGASDQYLILDSWVKDLSRSVPSRGIFSWNFMVQGVSSESEQNVGVKDKIDTVIEMQLGSFTIPVLYPGAQMMNPNPNGRGGVTYFPGFPGLTPVEGVNNMFYPSTTGGSALSYTFGFFPYVGRITIELQEIGLQAISQNGGTRYHFEADVIPVFPTQGSLSTHFGGAVTPALNPNPVAMRVVPLPGFDTYVFTDPIKDVHGLTLSFRSIDRVLPFPSDVIIGATPVVFADDYPSLAFSLGFTSYNDWANTARWLEQSVGLTQISISGLKTGNAPIDNWVNQAPSLVGTMPFDFNPGIGIGGAPGSFVSNGVTGQALYLLLAPLVDATPLVPIPPAGTQVIPSATSVTVRFTSARTRIPARFRRVVQRLTNYKGI